MQNKRLEKFLTLILRHKPEVVGIKLDSAGWVNVMDLVAGVKKHSQYKDFSISELQEITNNSEKKRFEFRTLGMWNKQIRARQGHSIEVNLEYESKVPPDVLYHGSENWVRAKIFEEGIRKMQRHHVHLSADREKAEGFARQRKKGPVLFVIDAKKMYEQGYSFYCTDNEVWLTEYVKPEFIIYCHDLTETK